jgi:hypothetical protein
LNGDKRSISKARTWGRFSSVAAGSVTRRASASSCRSAAPRAPARLADGLELASHEPRGVAGRRAPRRSRASRFRRRVRIDHHDLVAFDHHERRAARAAEGRKALGQHAHQLAPPPAPEIGEPALRGACAVRLKSWTGRHQWALERAAN